MKTYSYPELYAADPALAQRAAAVGRLSRDQMVIELPDDFDFGGEPHAQVARPPGTGDRLASVLKPIARAIDAVAGTDLEHCSACKKRQDWLNENL